MRFVANTWDLVLIETFFIYLKEKLAKGFLMATVLYVATFFTSQTNRRIEANMQFDSRPAMIGT